MNYTIMASHGRSEKINMAIESFLMQTTEDKILILVDDSGEGNISFSYDDSDRIVKLNNKANLGFTKSLNVALNYIKENYELQNDDTVSILDDDDIWCSREKLSKQISFLDANQSVDIVSSIASIISENGTLIKEKIPNYYGEISKDIIKIQNPIVHSSVTVRAKLLLNGLYSYDESLIRSQDWDLWIRLIVSRDIKAYIYPEKLVEYTDSRKLLTKIRKRRRDFEANLILNKRYVGLNLPTSWSNLIFLKISKLVSLASG